MISASVELAMSTGPENTTVTGPSQFQSFVWLTVAIGFDPVDAGEGQGGAEKFGQCAAFAEEENA